MPPSQKRRRSHALGVCISCRTRHVKCDMQYPSCSACKSIGVPCEAYEPELRWASAQPDNTGNKPREAVMQGLRKHLYTEQDRLSMSTALQSSLASAAIEDTLAEIERVSRDLVLVPGQSSFVGPFGVLELKAAEPEEAATVASRDGVLTPADNYLDMSDTMSMMLPSIISNEDLGITDTCLDWPDLFGMESLWPCPAFTPPPEPSIWRVQVPDAVTDGQTLPVCSTVPPPLDLVGIDISDVEALLSHYRRRVIRDMFSFPPHDKSPMEIMNATSAVVTLANVRYMGMERVTHASIANLLAVIALSAGHFAAGASTDPAIDASHWTKISSSAYEQGKAHMKHSLTVELRQPRPPKYKDQLMALSAILGFAILFDHQNDARAYLVDSERLLRLRGLAKRVVSRKCRLLHHVYTWNRILTESASVLRSKPGKEHLDRGWISIKEGEELLPGTHSHPRPSLDLDDFLRLEGGPSSTSPELGSQRDHGSSLNDIHLEDPREDAKALYRQLYGVSETWLSLVSQTTRLANIMDGLNSKQGRQDATLLDSIQRKKQWLEDMIWKLDATGSSGWTTSTLEGKAEQSRWYMVQALNQGLLIFFYRRIQYLDPRLLQPYVAGVIQALRNSREVCLTHNVEGSGPAWPVFMAGCEAMSQLDRDFVTSWLDEAYSRTGFTRFKTCKECMQMVWQRRNESHRKKDPRAGDPNWSWIDICRERNLHLLLS